MADANQLMQLSNEEKIFFDNCGYLKIDSLLGKSMLASILKKTKIELLNSDKSDLEKHRISGLIQRDKVFRDLAKNEALLIKLESLLGPNIVVALNRHNHATKNTSKNIARRLHRDILNRSRSIITVLIYLEDANISTGSTLVLPGSHKLPITGKLNNGGTWLEKSPMYCELASQAVPIEMSAGSVLLMDGMLFHAVSKPESDKRARTCISFAYHSVDELSLEVETQHRLLVKGENIYKGNDR